MEYISLTQLNNYIQEENANSEIEYEVNDNLIEDVDKDDNESKIINYSIDEIDSYKSEDADNNENNTDNENDKSNDT